MADGSTAALETLYRRHAPVAHRPAQPPVRRPGGRRRGPAGHVRRGLEERRQVRRAPASPPPGCGASPSAGWSTCCASGRRRRTRSRSTDLCLVESAEDRVLLGRRARRPRRCARPALPGAPRGRPGHRPRRAHHPGGRAAARAAARHREDPHDARATGSAEGARMTTWHLDRRPGRPVRGRPGRPRCSPPPSSSTSSPAPTAAGSIPRPTRRGSTPCGPRSSRPVEAPRVGVVETAAPRGSASATPPPGWSPRRPSLRGAWLTGRRRCSSACPGRRAVAERGHAACSSRWRRCCPLLGRGAGVRPPDGPHARDRRGVAVLPGPAARRPHRLRGRRPRWCRPRWSRRFCPATGWLAVALAAPGAGDERGGARDRTARRAAPRPRRSSAAGWLGAHRLVGLDGDSVAARPSTPALVQLLSLASCSPSAGARLASAHRHDLTPTAQEEPVTA